MDENRRKYKMTYKIKNYLPAGLGIPIPIFCVCDNDNGNVPPSYKTDNEETELLLLGWGRDWGRGNGCNAGLAAAWSEFHNVIERTLLSGWGKSPISTSILKECKGIRKKWGEEWEKEGRNERRKERKREGRKGREKEGREERRKEEMREGKKECEKEWEKEREKKGRYERRKDRRKEEREYSWQFFWSFEREKTRTLISKVTKAIEMEMRRC